MLNSEARSIDNHLRLALFCLLLGVYLLVYSPLVNSADGESLLNVTASAIRHGLPDIGLMGASESLLPFEMSRMGSFGEDGAYYSKKGLTPSIALAPLVLLAEVLPWLDTRATAMLLNPLVTALTAVLLYTLAHWLYYRPRTAFVLALIYGLATFSITYVKTLFGEPLAGLLLLAAVMGAYRYRYDGRVWYVTASGVCAGLLTGVNLVYVAVLPVLSLFILLPVLRSTLRGERSWRWFTGQAAAFALPAVAVLMVWGLYNWARFGDPLNTGYHFASGEGFNRPVLEGLVGLTVGSYRGLFWYNPVLLLSIPGWLMLRRAASWLAWLALTLILLGILLFAAWWSWDGGIAWGPRFLLTITPLAVLCLAPLIEAAWTQLWIAVPLIGLGGLSIAIQFLGAAYSIYPYISYLWEHYYLVSESRLADEVMTNPALSAILGHLALAMNRWPLEPAWVANGVDGVHLLVAIALMAVGVITVLKREVAAKSVFLLIVLVTAFSLNMVAARQQNGETYERVQAMNEVLQPPGTVLVASTLFGESLVDVDNGSWLLSTNAPTEPDDAIARQMTDFALAGGGNLWLVSWFSPADPANWQERELWANAAFAWERPIPNHRALLFNTSPVNPPNTPLGVQFGGIRLDRYGFTHLPEGLIVMAEWWAVEPLTADYLWFIHVIDADEQILGQQDRAPQGGYTPTSAWMPGESVIDRLYFPGLNPAGAFLRIGFIDPVSGERLPALDMEGEPLAEGFVLLPLE